jgi:lipoprotein-anchoring transpeptidase ErfK/SrfK
MAKADSTPVPPGTIVIDPANHFLYLVQSGGQAIRYGVGVGGVTGIGAAADPSAAIASKSLSRACGNT